MSKKLKIGLFGLGVVGQGFYELHSMQKNSSLEIKKIVIKNSAKPRNIETSLLYSDANAILNDPDIDIVVELIDDAGVALEILKRSIQKGKPVVTANKKMLAENLEEIYWLQKKYNTPVLYEGAVCGSIPIIKNLETHYAFDHIKSIEGIFNGSTNYILTQMIDEKKNYDFALKIAQQMGYAESDPTLDVKGFDPKSKLAIIIAHTFGCFVNPDQILNLGIDRITDHDIRLAKQQGCTIKLIAKAEQVGNKIFGLVAPMFVPLENSLAQVKNEFNAIHVTGASAGLQMLTGKGAGSLPTALAVLADVAGIASYQYQYSKIATNQNVAFEADTLVNVHISFNGADSVHLNDFEEFTGGYQGQDYQFMTGWISTQKLKEWANRDDLSIILNSSAPFRVLTSKKEREFSLV